MELRLELCVLVCYLIHATVGQYEALLSGLAGFGGGGNDMFRQGFASSMAFASSSSSSGSGSCPYTPHPDRHKFIQRVNGQTFVQSCAPGTIYNAQKCSCDNKPKSQPTPGAGNPMFGSSGLTLPGGGGGGGMASINDIVSQLQSQAMRPPAPSTGRRTAPIRPPSPTAARPRPIKPQSRSSTNHMDLIRKMTQNGQPGGLQLDVPKSSATGLSGSIQYTPKTPLVAPQRSRTLFKANIPPNPLRVAKPQTKRVVVRRRPTNGIPLYKKVPKLANPRTDPLAGLLMELSKQNSPSQTQSRGTAWAGSNTMSSLLGQSAGAPDMASLMAALGGGPMAGAMGGPMAGAMGGPMAGAMGGPSAGAMGGLMSGAMGGALGGAMGGSGGGAGLSSLLAGLGGGAGGAQNLLARGSLGGGLGATFGDTPSTPDLTSLFNLQGRAAGPTTLTGLSGINLIKLQELDRQGLIDLSDLSNAGALAASRHFG